MKWLEPDEQAAWRLLLRVTLTLIDRLDADLRMEHGVSFGDYEILAHLSGGPDRQLRMTDLADRALVSKSRLTHAVDRLEQRGLVCREPADDDRRGVSAVLTDEGIAFLQTAAPTHVEGVRRLLIDELPAGAVPELIAALQPVWDNLSGAQD